MINIFNSRSAALCAAVGALLAPLVLCGTRAQAQAGLGVSNSNAVILYAGQPLSSAQLKVTPWGGGLTSDHDGDAYTTAGHAIRVETAGLYQGGKITFNSPISLGDMKANKSRFLQIIFSADYSARYPRQITTPTNNMNPYGGPFGNRGPNMGPNGSPYGGMLPPGAGGRNPYQGGPFNPNAGIKRIGSYHYQFGQDWTQVAQAPPPGYNLPFGVNPGVIRGGRPMPGRRPITLPNGLSPYGLPGQRNPVVPDATMGLPTLPIKDLHLIFVFAGGTEVEMLRPITVSIGDDVSWLRAGVPLSAIPLPAVQAADAQLVAIYVASDTPAALTIGEIRLIDDATPITADAGKTQTIPTGTELTLVGTGEGGASALKYEWNFDNSASFVPEADGLKVSHTFEKAGDQTVTLRVSDVDGVKSPTTSTVTIHVIAP